MFPGFYPPRPGELKRFISEGLVVLDTNALLDMYRFTEDARADYIRALGLLGDRLWIPHQTAQEFFERRTTVIQSWRTDREDFDQELNRALGVVIGIIVGYAHRRGVDETGAQTITELVSDAQASILEKLDEVVDAGADIDPAGHPDDDPILQQVQELIDDKIGETPDAQYLAKREKEWNIRAAAHIPPGYKDARKGDRSIGDYLVWHQTLEEAKRRRTMPVLMICNEQKPDWVRRDGTYSGPRHELVKEMRDHVDQDFHLVDVHNFMTLANEHLSAHISDSTVDEASRLSDEDDPQPVSRREPASSEVALKNLAEILRSGWQPIGPTVDTSTFARQLGPTVDTAALMRDLGLTVDTSAFMRSLGLAIDPVYTRGLGGSVGAVALRRVNEEAKTSPSARAAADADPAQAGDPPARKRKPAAQKKTAKKTAPKDTKRKK
jgi:hypothetical protein